MIRGCRVAMPKNKPPKEPGKQHNYLIRKRWEDQQEKAKRDVERPYFAPLVDDIGAELVALLNEGVAVC
jgi:hypothetical protein